jgi:hypothetical protein
MGQAFIFVPIFVPILVPIHVSTAPPGRYGFIHCYSGGFTTG